MWVDTPSIPFQRWLIAKNRSHGECVGETVRGRASGGDGGPGGPPARARDARGGALGARPRWHVARRGGDVPGRAAFGAADLAAAALRRRGARPVLPPDASRPRPTPRRGRPPAPLGLRHRRDRGSRRRPRRPPVPPAGRSLGGAAVRRHAHDRALRAGGPVVRARRGRSGGSDLAAGAGHDGPPARTKSRTWGRAASRYWWAYGAAVAVTCLLHELAVLLLFAHAGTLALARVAGASVAGVGVRGGSRGPGAGAARPRLARAVRAGRVVAAARLRERGATAVGVRRPGPAGGRAAPGPHRPRPVAALRAAGRAVAPGGRPAPHGRPARPC